MNVVNASQYEDRFLGMIQRKINMLSRKKVQVVHKREGRTPVGRLQADIAATEREIRALEEKRRKSKEALKRALLRG